MRGPGEGSSVRGRVKCEGEGVKCEGEGSSVRGWVTVKCEGEESSVRGGVKCG